MRAIVQERYGSADVLKLSDIEQPAMRGDELLVRVHAAGVDRGVWHLMTGLPYLVRFMGYGLRAPRSRIPGIDIAGRVEAVGARVTRFQPGDAVFGVCEGAFAEYARSREDGLAPKPANLAFEEAAAVPTSAATALQGLRDVGRVEAGQKVLIIGAGGGVGAFAVQLAKAFGAEVTGVCSAAKADLVRSIGADDVVDYTREDFADSARRYDLILDTAGNRSLSHLRRALSRSGTLVIIGGEGGGRWFGGVDRQLRALLLSPFVGQSLRGLFSVLRQADLQYLKDLIEAGRITPIVDRVFPLAEAPDAIRYLERGRARGKIVVAV